MYILAEHRITFATICPDLCCTHCQLTDLLYSILLCSASSLLAQLGAVIWRLFPFSESRRITVTHLCTPSLSLDPLLSGWQETAGGLLADLRLLQLPSKVLPYKIPEEYNSLPRLAGRVRAKLDDSLVAWMWQMKWDVEIPWSTCWIVVRCGVVWCDVMLWNVVQYRVVQCIIVYWCVSIWPCIRSCLHWLHMSYNRPESFLMLTIYSQAEVELIIKSAGKGFRLEDGKTVVQTVPFRLVLDGYHAPLTAGKLVHFVCFYLIKSTHPLPVEDFLFLIISVKYRHFFRILHPMRTSCSVNCVQNVFTSDILSMQRQAWHTCPLYWLTFSATSHFKIFLLLKGNFVDLVNRKWYDGMPLQKVEQLTVQTGKPVGGEGYTDPKTKEVRVPDRMGVGKGCEEGVSCVC